MAELYAIDPGPGCRATRASGSDATWTVVVVLGVGLLLLLGHRCRL